jgi:PAS domain S-box-containing protein
MKNNISTRPVRRGRGKFLAFFLLFAAVIGVGGWQYFNQKRAEARQTASNELAAIADLKAGQISNWLKERRGDAEIARKNPHVRRFLADSSIAAAREELLGWLAAFQQTYNYSAVALSDSRGVIRLAVPADALAQYPCIDEHVKAALTGRDILFVDLHRARSDLPIHLSLIVPIRVNPQSGGPADGVLALIIDPYRFLYPLVQTWPLPSSTAETLLVRHEGNDILFLNKLRHRNDTALSIRFPLESKKNLPAARAVQGYEGILEGNDYRGRLVLAATRRIPGMPWFMVAKVDRDEVYAPVRREESVAGLVIVLLLLTATLVVGLMWRQQRINIIQRELTVLKASEERAKVAEAEKQRLLEASEKSRLSLLSVIEDQKAAEEALRISEAQLSDALRMARAGHWEYDILRDTFRFNDNFYRIFRTTAKDIGGYTMSSADYARRFCHPADAPLVAKEVQAAIETTDPNYSRQLEHRILYADGEAGYITVRFFIAKDATGRTVKTYGVNQDITERKKAERELQESEERFRTLYENTTIGLFRTTPDGRIILANPTLVKMLGYSSFGELAERNLEKDGFEPSYPRSDFLKRLDKDGKIIALESAWKRQDGTVIYVRESASTIRDAQGRILYYDGTVEDITARKKAEEEKARIEAQLQQQQKLESIGTLASGVAHEINNPINGIMNYAQLIADGLEAKDPLWEYATEITKETERISAIVHNLLAFARQEKQSHSPAHLEDIVNSTLSLIRAVIRHDQIRLDVDIPEGLPKIKCRSQQIQQVILNLLTNARDALNEKYPGYHEDKIVRITVRLLEKDGRRWIRTIVENHGSLIPPEVRDHLFDPFFTTKPKDKGTGLGLSISYGIMKDHGGELYLDSEVGSPTRFHMDLPADNGWNLET